MTKIKLLFTLIFVTAGISGCASSDPTGMSTQVHVTHTLPRDLTGKKYLSLAIRGEAGRKEESLFSSEIMDAIRKTGMVAVDKVDNADYVLSWDYELIRKSVVTDSTYRHVLTLQMVDEVKTRDENSGLFFAYSATAVSEGPPDAFARVSHCMVQALLADFPGKRRQSRSAGMKSGCLR